jgi:hypothetical protein
MATVAAARPGYRVLRVRHLLALAGLLRVPPADFLEIGLPEASRAADLRLTQWIDPVRPRAAAEPAGDWQVEHLTALARLLRIPPGDLLARAPAANAAAEHRLADWLGLAAPATSAISDAITPAAPSPDELAAMVRAAVQQALAERKAP